MPGEKGSPPEVICLHDLTPPLGELETDLASAMQVTRSLPLRGENPVVCRRKFNILPKAA